MGVEEEMKVKQGQYDSEWEGGRKYKEPATITNVTLRRAEIERGSSAYLTKWINVLFPECPKLLILIYLVQGFIVKFLMGGGDKQGPLYTQN